MLHNKSLDNHVCSPHTVIGLDISAAAKSVSCLDSSLSSPERCDRCTGRGKSEKTRHLYEKRRRVAWWRTVKKRWRSSALLSSGLIRARERRRRQSRFRKKSRKQAVYYRRWWHFLPSCLWLGITAFYTLGDFVLRQTHQIALRMQI